MREIIYTIQDFDAQKANNGALCIVLRNDALVSDPSSDDNADRATYGSQHGEYTGRICSIEHFTTGDAISSLSPNPFIYGIGTCIYRNSYYIISVQNVTYTFDASGKGISENTLPVEGLFAGLCMKIAVVGTEEIMAGNDVTTSLDLQHYTSEDSGFVSTEDIALKQIAVRNVADLNARDKFAIKVLQSLLEKTSYPSSMSINEMSHYCEKAYAWADSMMVSAANRRMVTNAYWQKDTDVENIPYDSYSQLTPSSGHAVYTSAEEAIEDGWVWHESTPDEKGPTENFQELIEAVSQINTGGGTTDTVNIGSSGLGRSTSPFYVQNVGGGGGGGSFDGEITAMPALDGTINIGSTGLGSSSSPLFNKVKIGSDEVASNNPLYVGLSSNGYGCDSNHPLYISGGTFPSRQALAAEFNYATMHDLLAFNSNGAVGYITKTNLKEGILDDVTTSFQNVTTSILNLATSLLDANVKITYTEEDGVYSFTSSIIKRLYCERADFKDTETDSIIGTIINRKFGGYGRQFNPIFKIVKVGTSGGTYWYFYTYRINYMGTLYYACYNAATNVIDRSSEPASGQEETLSAQLASVVADTLGVTFSNSTYFGNSAVVGEDVKYRIDV